jgi:hypothetical protein
VIQQPWQLLRFQQRLPQQPLTLCLSAAPLRPWHLWRLPTRLSCQLQKR